MLTATYCWTPLAPGATPRRRRAPNKALDAWSLAHGVARLTVRIRPGRIAAGARLPTMGRLPGILPVTQAPVLAPRPLTLGAAHQ